MNSLRTTGTGEGRLSSPMPIFGDFVKQERREQPNTARADSTQPQNSLWKGENCTRLAQLIRSYQCLWKIAVSNCKTGTPAHTGPATLGTTKHRQSRQHSITELTLERRNLHTAGSAYPVLPVTMEKSQFQTVKQERQLTQGRQRWEQPNTGRAESTQPQNSLWKGENCTRLAQLIRSYQCLWKNCSFKL